MTGALLTFDLTLNYLTIKEKSLEKGKVYKLILPQKLISDPTKIVYSILLLSTVDKSEKISIIDS